MEEKRLQELHELESRLGVRFSDINLLNQSLTHTSFIGEKEESRLESNQRLEYLGDAVLGLAVSFYLYEQHPELFEGQLTKIKAAAVSEPILCRVAEELQLGRYLLLGRGEELTGGRQRPSILSDALEAIVAAIFLDRGFEEAQRFIRRTFGAIIEDIRHQRQGQDFKSMLQEKIQSRTNRAPEYEVVEEIGPDHNKRFVVEVRMDDQILGTGFGASKKEAEQAAAAQALEAIESE
jgi:ribonuclease-3